MIPTEAENSAAKIYTQMHDALREKAQEVRTIKNLVEQYPNDQDLGREVRKLLTKENP